MNIFCTYQAWVNSAVLTLPSVTSLSLWLCKVPCKVHSTHTTISTFDNNNDDDDDSNNNNNNKQTNILCTKFERNCTIRSWVIDDLAIFLKKSDFQALSLRGRGVSQTAPNLERLPCQISHFLTSAKIRGEVGDRVDTTGEPVVMGVCRHGQGGHLPPLEML